MKRLLPTLGVLVLLLSVQIECSSNNKKSFWDLWSSAKENVAPATGSEDFTLDNEGSGDEDLGLNKVDHTHADDEDYDVVGSGDDDTYPTTVPPVTDKDDVFIEKDDDKGTDKHDTVPTDDEDLDTSGSGLGVEEPIVPVDIRPVDKAVPTTTPKPLTACENLRSSALLVSSSFMPECDLDGQFKKQQCMVDIKNKEKNCWCVDPDGREIQGTRMKQPKSPDCVYGENLSTCVFQLVQHSQRLLGAYKPICNAQGEYEPVQCQGSECWCVDAVGNEITGTIVNKPNMPKCPPATTVTTTRKPETNKTRTLAPAIDPTYTIGGNKTKVPDVIVDIPTGISIDSEEEDFEEKDEETNQSGDSYATMRHNEPILAQPGLLAAIIGGAVVGLLCMVLLVMFIVYRMRKKDEGSYPLDEQKYQNYSYTKAPDKEFYA